MTTLLRGRILTFHGDPQRTGWVSRETILTPANVPHNLNFWGLCAVRGWKCAAAQQRP